MPLDCRVDNLLLERLNLGESAFLVAAHERRKAHHVGRENGRESPLNPGRVACHPGMVLPAFGFV